MSGLEFLPLVGILLVFWLLVIRPTQRRQREQMRLQSSVEIGDQVVLTSGFFGTIRALHDDRLEVEIAPATVVTVARAAIGTVVRDEPLDDHDQVDTGESTGPDEPRPSLDKKTTDAPEGGES